jgi:antitoxin Phd
VKKKSKRAASLRARAARKPATKAAAVKGWTLRAAKARFSELVRQAQKQPQRVTCRGEDAVVVLSAVEYDRLTQGRRRKSSLMGFLKNTGFGELDLERPFEPSRDIDL